MLSAELGGMAVGALLLGMLADRIGRRSVVLLCLTLMSIGLLISASAGDSIELLISRTLTGFGIERHFVRSARDKRLNIPVQVGEKLVFPSCPLASPWRDVRAGQLGRCFCCTMIGVPSFTLCAAATAACIPVVFFFDSGVFAMARSEATGRSARKSKSDTHAARTWWGRRAAETRTQIQ